MTAPILCKDVEELLFELRRDEVSDIKRSAIDEHLSTCGECQELITKMGGLLDMASDGEPSLFADIDEDALFGRIESSIADDAAAPDARLDDVFTVARTSNGEPGPDFDRDELFERITGNLDQSNTADPLRSPRRPRRVWAAAVAAACIAVFVAWWTFSDDSSPIADPLPVKAPTVVAVDDTEAPAEETKSPQFEFPQLSTSPSSDESIRLFTAEDSEYRRLDEPGRSVVELESGSILIEYLTGQDSKFELKARGYTITVVGTVFYVTIDEDAPEITVFEGTVRVTSPDGSERTITGGEISDELNVQISAYVDLAAHRRALEEADQKAEAPSVEKPALEEPSVAEAPVEEEPEVVEELAPQPPSARELRRQALQAVHQGEFRRATTLLARALEKTEPDEQATADILLELARIHMRELDEPEQAADYLNRFLSQWPDDPAAEAIRSQLCAMSTVAESDDEMCP
jgi:tetratricopeptide (TPR) repeat protein